MGSISQKSFEGSLPTRRRRKINDGVASNPSTDSQSLLGEILQAKFGPKKGFSLGEDADMGKGMGARGIALVAEVARGRRVGGSGLRTDRSPKSPQEGNLFEDA